MPAKFRVEITRTAEADADEIRRVIGRDDPDAADRFAAELERQVETLERLPQRCPLIPENTLLRTAYRHLLFGDYRTIFRVSNRTVLVLRIVHSARLLDSSMFVVR